MMIPVGTNDQPRTGTAVQERTPVATFDSTGTIRIGRDTDNDIVLPDFWVSRKHAEIRKVGTEYHVVDLASSNGLHHNGRRVPKAVLAAGDRVTIGRHEFLFDGTHLFQHDDQGPTSIIADDITVEVKKAVLLDDISFALRHGTLLGIVGPSGCGKSTLLKAMTGIRPASRGKLLYDGKDLYKHYSELRYRIGMVPQDDVLHRQLTVRRALRFAASLRFASDVPRKLRKQRVNEVLELLGLTARANQRIDTLSGGQRKRTSVRARTAHRALAAGVGRAHVRPGPGAGQRGNAGAAPARRPRPYRRRGHPQRAAPGPVRPRHGDVPGRSDGLLWTP